MPTSKKPRRRGAANPKNLRRDVAFSDVHHQAVLQACIAELNAHSCFSKDEIIAGLRYHAIAPAIRWDYVVEWLEDRHIAGCGFTLVAVSGRFFAEKVWSKSVFSGLDKSGNPTSDADVLAGRYTATGHGKKTAGYCLAKLHGGLLLLYRVKVDIAKRNGIDDAMKGRVTQTIGDPAINPVVRQQISKLTQ